ncbi:MAG: hypothetical protein JSS83_20610 [Cyanobacteria bacterium SZAS LIN-3]|nr:hypothetical protein [Cyanobacteria bacterium SZAS LIN-3]
MRMFGQFLLVLILAIAVLEGFFAWAGVGEQNFLKPDRELGTVHIPGKRITWRLEGYSSDRLSVDGWRDRDRSKAKPAKVFRIALLGDSQTESLQVPLDKDWASLTEQRLNQVFHSHLPQFGYDSAEVLNFGVSGYSTGQELLLLKRSVLAYKPDLVVLFYNQGDSAENVFSLQNYRDSAPRPYFYLDEHDVLRQDSRVLISSKARLESDSLIEYLRSHSRIFGVWQQAIFLLNLNDKLFIRLRHFVENLFSRRSNLETGGRLRQDDRKVTRALLEEMAAVCKSNHIRFMVMTFPNLGNGNGSYEVQLSQLRDMSLKDGFDVLELSNAFRDYSAKEPLFFQVHFAPAGHRVTAQALSQRIVRFLTGSLISF